MISDPDLFVAEFVEALSTSFLVHWEGNNNLHCTVQHIKSLGNAPEGNQSRYFCDKSIRIANWEVTEALMKRPAPTVVAAGANVLVAGTSVFATDKDVAAAMDFA